MTASDVLDRFHPLVRDWFHEKFPGGPTETQVQGWPSIQAGKDTLIAAPTGSGKTLTAFLAGINALIEEDARGELHNELRILYISPLKALANDIQRSLNGPLDEIANRAFASRQRSPNVRTAVRTGDSTREERDYINNNPPHVLNTTPESFHIMLSSPRGRAIFRTVETVIIDEIHHLIQDKRGTHLALALARLDHIAWQRPARIGLSATQKPMDEVAAYLSGLDGDGKPLPCTIIDLGHQQQIDVWLEPTVKASASEFMFDRKFTVGRVAELIREHLTTLVFVNSRAVAESVAGDLRELLGEDAVGVHHSAVSRARRDALEEQMKRGDIPAVVATSSLELGIDIGAVDLVCQLGSPKRIATFLQRVGRSGRVQGRIPNGALFPMSVDGWIEGAALVQATRAGTLDALQQPPRPLDVLAQHIAAETSVTNFTDSGALFDMFRCAAPYADLTEEQFGAVVQMQVDGVGSGRARSQPLIEESSRRDGLVPLRDTRRIALTNSGTIPDTGTFRAVNAENLKEVGILDELFASSLEQGVSFMLARHYWQVRRVDPEGIVWVSQIQERADPPSWPGEGIGRSRELSAEVGKIRRSIIAAADQDGSAVELLHQIGAAGRTQSNTTPAELAVLYLSRTEEQLGVIPSELDVVVEYTWEEERDEVTVVHAPFGLRINRAWAAAVLELAQREGRAGADGAAAITDEGFTVRGIPKSVFPAVNPRNAVELVERAAPFNPFWPLRWRWAATIALAVHRVDTNGHIPILQQQSEAAHLYAAVINDLPPAMRGNDAALPTDSHPLLYQTLQDILHSAMDLDGLVDVLGLIESGDIQMHFATTQPMTPMAEQLLPPWYRNTSDPPSADLTGHGVRRRLIRRGSTRRLPSDSSRELLRRPRQIDQD